MTAPHPDGPRDPVNTYDGVNALLRRLSADYGAAITFTQLDDDIGIWDGDNRTVTVDVRSSVEDQLHFLIQCWEHLTIGPHATDLELVTGTPLRLVT